MKTRKILVASIPLIAATAIAGSGFAAWYFGNVTYGDSNSVTIEQTAYSEAGTITAGNSYTLVFDQGHYANRSETAAGIYVFDSTVTDYESAINSKSYSDTTLVHADNECTIEADYSGLSTDAVKNLYNADFDSITFTATITIGSYLTDYLTFQSSSSSATIGGTSVNGSVSGNTLTFTSTIELSASGSAISSSDPFFEIDATTTGEGAVNSLFAYNSKPQDASSYSALAAVLASEGLTSSSTDANGCVYYPNAISITYTATLNAHH